jgi:3-dehydroquinate dehydratase/shikimate dehydrogenase
VWEGGSFQGSEEERKRLLSDALAEGAEYVDVEFRAGFDDLIARARGRRIVLSSHDFEGIPSDLDARVDRMRATGAEIVKVAVRTRRLCDAVTLAHVGTRVGRDAGLVIVGMGEEGIVTRVLPSRFNSKWTYAGELSGIGQVTPQLLFDQFRFREVTSTTALYGVVGSPVSHSVSPVMHNRAFSAADIDAVYLPLRADDADDFVTFGRAFGVSGASVTTPYKVALASRVDEVTGIAARLGAINTIRVAGGRWLGDNSDVAGFLEPLAGRLSLGGLRAAVLGAGGAARAVAAALALEGARVSVHARNESRAVELAHLTAGTAGPWPPEPGSWDLLVNCTPVGMYPDVEATPIAREHLSRGTVYDLVYNPPRTRLLREAEAAGCRTIGGLEMLVAQARRQFEWWTGVQPAAELMRRAALDKLAAFAAVTEKAEV